MVITPKILDVFGRFPETKYPINRGGHAFRFWGGEVVGSP